MSINERIKELRKSLGLTQTEFGRKIGIVQGHLTGIENGKKSVTESTIKVICSVYGASENWMRTGKGEMFVRTNGENIYNAVRIFKKLNSDYQDYVLQQVKDLLEAQRKQNESS